MSQITRCPHCATAFKVVPDQLRISEGWVRCGQCKQVFDAAEHLLDLPAAVPPSVPVTEHESEPAAAAVVSADEVSNATKNIALTADPEPQFEDFSLNDGAAAAQIEAEVEADFSHLAPAPVAASALASAKEEAAAMPPIQRVWSSARQPLPVLPAAPLPPDLPPLPPQEPLRGAGFSSRFAAHSSLADSSAGPTLPRGWHDSAAPLDWQEPALKSVETPADSGDFVAPVHPAEPLEQAASTQWPEAGLEPAPTDAAPADAVASSEALPPAPQPDLPAPAPAPDALPVHDGAVLPGGAPPIEQQVEPSFVTAAKRSAFWRQPGVRWALWLLSLVLALSLGLQVMLQQRHFLAAYAPGLKPLLLQLCSWRHCDLRPPQRIAAVLMDGSSFVRLRGESAGYQLQMSVKNTASIDIAMPALELTLTDARDQPVLRRVLLPADMAAPLALPAGDVWAGEVNVQLRLDAAQVAGYRVLAFYP